MPNGKFPAITINATNNSQNQQKHTNVDNIIIKKCFIFEIVVVKIIIINFYFYHHHNNNKRPICAKLCIISSCVCVCVWFFYFYSCNKITRESEKEREKKLFFNDVPIMFFPSSFVRSFYSLVIVFPLLSLSLPHSLSRLLCTHRQCILCVCLRFYLPTIQAHR